MSIISRLSKSLKSRSITYQDIWKHYLGNIKNYNDVLNAVVQTVPLAQIEHQPNEGSMLNGIPIIYKDNICTTQLRTTCASRMLQDYVSPFNATVFNKLHAAGSVMLGKANLDEFAMGATTSPELYGATKNPWDLALGTGGSSGGSAAAVSARFAPIALGSDTGGSIRLPAYFCGVIGMKPTYGAVSRYGLVSYASSLDQIGVAGLSAQDIAYVFDTLGGTDPQDPTTISLPTNFFSRKLVQPPQATIGVDYSLFSPTGAGHHFILHLKHAGYEIKSITLPPMEPAQQCYYIVACTEAASNLSRFDGIRYGGKPSQENNLDNFYRTQRSEGFGQAVKTRIMAGNFFVSPGNYENYYGNATRYRRYLFDTYEELYRTHDLDCILMPVCSDVDTAAAGTRYRYELDTYSVIANLLGYPAVSFPVSMYGSRPLGVQLMGRAMKDDVLLHVVNKMQEYNDVLKSLPPFGGQDLI
jgi:aspartyl-tRNA(Asn)/glutamyl-tRNA(Gln) amidotransferase subunit A